MPVGSLGELWSALAQGGWDTVIGSEETDWVDYKRDPYQLDDAKQQWELAKDVAALANARGGTIVIGFDTKALASAATDVVTEHRPVRRSLVNGQRIVDLVESRIYPRVREVRLKWFPDNSDLAVLVIEVAPQDDAQKPFLLEGSLGDDGKLRTGTIGWPRREGARVEWVRAAAMHNVLRDGLSSVRREGQQVQNTMHDRIEQLQRGTLRWDEIVSVMGWTETPYMLLQALPPLGTRSPLRGFHEEAGVRGRFRSPPSLRQNGFNLSAQYPHEVREGSLTYLADPRRALWLDSDGMFSIGGAATEDWFGWAINDRGAPSAPLRLNSLVLAEYSLEFLRFVHSVLVPLASGEWLFRARVGNLRTPRGTLLRGGPPDSWSLEPWSGNPVNAGEMQPLPLSQPGSDALAFLTWFYGLYGIPASEIAFVDGDAISEKLLLEAGTRR